MMPDDPFGAPVGKMVDLSGAELKNEFTNIPTQNIEDMLQSTRIQPRQMGTGVMRGTQRIVNTDGSYITLGEIPDTDNEFGIAFFTADDVLVSTYKADDQTFYDEDGNIVSQQTDTTQFIYDVTTGKNIMQIGRLPDGTYGLAVAKAGYNISDAIT